jgi:hypothetical protein
VSGTRHSDGALSDDGDDDDDDDDDGDDDDDEATLTSPPPTPPPPSTPPNAAAAASHVSLCMRSYALARVSTSTKQSLCAPRRLALKK